MTQTFFVPQTDPGNTSQLRLQTNQLASSVTSLQSQVGAVTQTDANGNTSPIAAVQTNVTSSRAFGTTYSNPTVNYMIVEVTVEAPAGTSGTATVSRGPSGALAAFMASSATASGASPVAQPLTFFIPAGNSYEVTIDTSLTSLYWYETTFA